MSYIKQEMKGAQLTEPEVAPIVWSAIIGTLDLINARPDQVESQVLRVIKVSYTHIGCFSIE